MERCVKFEAISLSSPLVAGQDGKAVEVGKEFVYGRIVSEGSLFDC
jgi:hypothetical protein